MSAKQKESLAKYLIIGGALSFAYLMVNYFSKGPSGRKNLKIAEIHRVLKEIKYQVYANCISFSEGIKATISNKSSKSISQEVQKKLRGQLVKTYDAKENLILKKYDISKEDFSNALKKYQNDKIVKADQAEIFKVMQDTLKGEINITTPPQAERLNSFSQIIKLHHDLCLQIGVKVWEKLDYHKKNNPNFDSKSDEDFRSAIRQLNIYDFKVNYLKNIGYREEWGCPNLNLLKLVQAAKRGNPQHKIQAICIEKAYETVIAKVSNEPESYDRGKVEDLFEQIRSETRKALQPQPQVKSEPLKTSTFKTAPAAAQVPIVQSKPAPLPVQKVKKEEEEQQYDMEKLMMAQLLSRSQEEPKEEHKVQAKVQQKVQIIEEQRPSSAPRKIEAEEEERPSSAPRKVEAEEEERPSSALRKSENNQQHGDQRVLQVQPVAQTLKVQVQQNPKQVQKSEEIVNVVEEVERVQDQNIANDEIAPVVDAEPLRVAEQFVVQQPKIVESEEVAAQVHEQPKLQQSAQISHVERVAQQIKQEAQKIVETEPHEIKHEHQVEEHRE